MKRVYAILGSLGLLGMGPAALAQAACFAGPVGGPLTATLAFTPPTANTDGTSIAGPLTYNLYQSTAPGAEVKVASALAGSPIKVTTGVKASSTLYWKLSVVDANGVESALSNEVCKTFPASVPGVVTITIS